jgi:hypothetical protein
MSHRDFNVRLCLHESSAIVTLNSLTVSIVVTYPTIHFDVTTIDDFATIFIRILMSILKGLFEGISGAALVTETPPVF